MESYSIPEGIYSRKGTLKPELKYLLWGHRNPYRISVDPKRGYVYWGDVG